MCVVCKSLAAKATETPRWPEPIVNALLPTERAPSMQCKDALQKILIAGDLNSDILQEPEGKRATWLADWLNEWGIATAADKHLDKEGAGDSALNAGITL